MIKDATANKVTEDIFDEKYGVAGIGLQLKMLMWRAYIARYKVNSHQNHFLPGWSYEFGISETTDSVKIKIHTSKLSSRNALLSLRDSYSWFGIHSVSATEFCCPIQ